MISNIFSFFISISFFDQYLCDLDISMDENSTYPMEDLNILDEVSYENVENYRRLHPEDIHDDFLSSKSFNRFETWMEKLSDDISLTKVTFPGTHNTMALFGGGLSECQTLYLRDQLIYGIRAFDIRCRHYENNCAIHHGVVYQNVYLDDVLKTFQLFLNKYPSEMILMKIKQEYEPDKNTRSIEATLNEILGRYQDNIWSGKYRIPSLGECRGKIVVIDNVLAGQFGVPYVSQEIQDEYHVPDLLSGTLSTKWVHVSTHMHYANISKDGKLYINFLSGSSAFAHPYHVSKAINMYFIEHLRRDTMSYQKMGVLYMDYPYGEQLLQIISSNFQHEESTSVVQLYDETNFKGSNKVFVIEKGVCMNLLNWNDKTKSYIQLKSFVLFHEHKDCKGETYHDVIREVHPSKNWHNRFSSIRRLR